MNESELHQRINELNRNSSLEYLIGFNICVILSRDIFKKNQDVGMYIKTIYKKEYPLYVMKSRTLIIAKLSRDLITLDKKQQKEVVKDINAYFSIDSTVTLVQKTKTAKNISKWVQGIINEE